MRALAILLGFTGIGEGARHVLTAPQADASLAAFEAINTKWSAANMANTLWTFQGVMDNGLTYQYSINGMWAYYQPGPGGQCPVIVEADSGLVIQDKPARCGMYYAAEHNLSYQEMQARFMHCHELWPTSWQQANCVVTQQNGRL